LKLNRLPEAGLKDFDRGGILREAGGLAELITGLTPGQEIIITSNDQPVAELRPLPAEGQPRFGSCKGSLVILAEDDERLKDFAEHMQ
jgi:antitoxin (DNA-binding transcriptional repressor) of toxin-antitoxin stability system